MEAISNLFISSFLRTRWYFSSIVAVGGSNGRANEGKDNTTSIMAREVSLIKAQESLTKDLAAVDSDLKSKSFKNYIPGREEIRRVFDKFDENSDGVICTDELGRFMKKLGFEVSDAEVTALIKTVDDNCDGSVDFGEFYALYSSLGALGTGAGSGKTDEQDSALMEAFQVFDKNGDGFITVQELQSVLQNLGLLEGNSLKKCHQMIQSVDRDGNGQVDFEEFKTLMSSDCVQSL